MEMEMTKPEMKAEYEELMENIRKVFSNILGFENAKKYINGLLGPSERKNGWQISESQGLKTPYEMQQFIYRGKYSATELKDELRGYIGKKLGEADGVLVVDETGFLKQGKKSCGVKRQYSGTAGRIENCQIGVFLTYAGSKGHNPIDRRLYIPEDWIKDKERCAGAGIPETVTFQTKPQMALEMLQEATKAELPYTWVTGDCVYGDYTDIRLWLEQQKKCYVMGVSGKAYVWQGYTQKSVSSIMKNLPNEGWSEASCGDGSKGARLYDWLTVQINPGPVEGYNRTLLFRRSQTSPDEIRAYLCFAPADGSVEKMIKVAGTRWTVETCFKESKSQVGLDQYEVRSYNGWYKHITFACIAMALLTVLSYKSGDSLRIQQHAPGEKSLDAFKRGRNLRV
jgi:SRSO17 transposase